MTDGSANARVQFDGTGLVLAEDPERSGAYRFPRQDQDADGALSSLPLSAALHARIRPVGTAESVLRDWATGAPLPETAPWDDPAAAAPVRVRAGAIVLRDEHMLLIEFDEDGEVYFEIPGGGVEPGESLHDAVVRELREETALAGTVTGEVARVWKEGRREHYFLMSADGEVGDPALLDNYGGRPRWMPVHALPSTALWPRRLAWRIARWHTTGWPGQPAELADSIQDLRADCTW
ncbi:NUDIX domain-containing protein [Streptomyces sp. NBC_01304]|uniref:NUDIX domain-containing protein n=1 Tax=Streptomyces sp. NBC_01304 TaxID=2903818 RepID=UPI002E0DACA4|nr:NUDIX domain-containing protein [Streptomyces sp. NBC_01304]